MTATIRAIHAHFPQTTLTTGELAQLFPDWGVEKIDRRTGIACRYISQPNECASDLAVEAARKLFIAETVDPATIDCLLFCTQTPDYKIPATACLLQARLNLPTRCFAIDINQGCSGYVYSLGVANSLIETGQVRRVLLLCSDTITKFLNPTDRSVRTLFGDAATATLIEADEATERSIGPFLWGTDGRGACNIMMPDGGARWPGRLEPNQQTGGEGRQSPSSEFLTMNGAEVFEFTLSEVPKAFEALLSKAGKTKDEIDLFFFHQANRFMLTSLRQALAIPESKFCFAIEDGGNTTSSSIPITLIKALHDGQLKAGALIMLLGFGVGYSWAGALVRWR